MLLILVISLLFHKVHYGKREAHHSIRPIVVQRSNRRQILLPEYLLLSSSSVRLEKGLQKYIIFMF